MPPIRKLPAGVEDLTFGMDTEHQTRQGTVYIINQINASHIPLSAVQTVAQKFGIVDGKIAQYDNYIVITNATLLTKTDKVVGATHGNYAALDSEGNLIDSGISALSGNMNKVDPAVDGNLLSMNADGQAIDSGTKVADFALVVHAHAISDVTGLQTALDGKEPADATILKDADIGVSVQAHLGFTPENVANILTSITGFQVTPDDAHYVSEKLVKDALDGKATLVHTHAISDVTGLQTALDGKASTVHVHAISDVTGLQTALDGKEPADATILKDADIGVTVQAYENRAVTAEDNAIDFGGITKNYELTATAANITATNITATKEGTILVHSAENITGWGVEFKFKTVPTDLTGDEVFSYFIEDATNIWIGRVQ